MSATSEPAKAGLAATIDPDTTSTDTASPTSPAPSAAARPPGDLSPE